MRTKLKKNGSKDEIEKKQLIKNLKLKIKNQNIED
jgi:hypothetical protein